MYFQRKNKYHLFDLGIYERLVYLETIDKNPQTSEKMCILLIHYLAKLRNKDDVKAMPPIKEVIWLDIDEIKQDKHNVAPNIKFLIEKGRSSYSIAIKN